MLATTAILTLQLDIRAGIIHMLTRTFSNPYLLPHAATDPDPNILTLSADLLSLDNTLTTHLPSTEHVFITTGLTQLVDTFLIRNAGKVDAMNANGCGRMQLNILVLQQNLIAVETHGEVALSRSAAFFDLFLEGAEGVIQRAKLAAQHGTANRNQKNLTEKENEDGQGAVSDNTKLNTNSSSSEAGTGTGTTAQSSPSSSLSPPLSPELTPFTLEEMKVLLELCYSEGLRSDKREVVVQAKRGLNEHMLALSEFLWDA